MTTIQSVLPMSRDAIKSLSQSRQEPEWLTQFRLEALELAEQLELPKLEKTRIERWKLDSYGQYKAESTIPSVDKLPEKVQSLLTEEHSASNLIVQRNSSVVYSAADEEWTKQGVIFMSLEQAAKEHPELVQKYLMKAVTREENQLTALHGALWTGGVFLYVPENVNVKIPMQAVLYSDDSEAMFTPHILIVAEANSSVTYVENVLSDNGATDNVYSGIVEVFAGQGAAVQFAGVHNLQQQFTDISYRRAILQNDARIHWVIGEMNFGNGMSDTNSILRGNGSVSDAKVICVGTNDQQLNVSTRATHFGRSTESDMITRAVMRDKSTAIINGITKIEKGATNANGEQTERILMLSPDARGDANPILLIDEDEVTAGHAASAGQVDENHVYYMMSRGIPREDAVRLVIYGFLAPVVSTIPLQNVEQQLQRLVERKLGQ